MDVIFYQLDQDKALPYRDLEEIARLIYKTDEYIYPCLFKDEEQAAQILSDCLKNGKDKMFNLNNIYACKIDDMIAGIILWVKGPLVWDDIALIEVFEENAIPLPKFLDKVKCGYFFSYKDTPFDTLSLINVAVAPRFRGRKLGSMLLESFLKEHINEKCELYVLSENLPAIHVYEKNGFKQVGSVNGFSYDDRVLPCLIMERIPEKKK